MFAHKNGPTPFAPVLTIKNLFTSMADGLFNLMRYLREDSPGAIALTGSQRFGPFVNNARRGALEGAS